MPQAYRDTRLADILRSLGGPGEIEDPAEKRYSTWALTNGYPLALNRSGPAAPISFPAEDAENARNLERAGGRFITGGGYRTKPAAEVLATHPDIRPPNRRRDGRRTAPAGVQSFVGAGRAMFFGSTRPGAGAFARTSRTSNQFWLTND